MIPLAAWIAAACRLYVLILLVAAVAGKAAALEDFRFTLAGMFRLSDRAAGAAALAVIGAEAAIAAALLLAPRPAMAAALALFALLWLVILTTLARRQPLVCNCFGGRARPISALDLVRNAFPIAACVFFLMTPPAASFPPAALLPPAGVALILVLVSTHLDEIAELTGLREAPPPLTLTLGETVAPFGPGGVAGSPLVLVFLSPACPTCAGRIDELVGLLPGARRAGVALWIVPNDDRHDIAELVAGTALAERVLLLDAAAREMLNPRRGAPFYVFIDEAMVARASNYLGDEDWRTFVAQMREAAAETP